MKRVVAGAVDRWRWFWGKPDIITMHTQRMMGGDRRPLDNIERVVADGVARKVYQQHRKSSRRDRAVIRQEYMASDRQARKDLRDWHKKIRSGRS